jgi:hypothetical protein
LQKLKQIQKKSTTDVIFDRDVLEVLEKKFQSVIVPPHDLSLEKIEFLELLKEEIRTWRTKIHRESDKLVLDAIILLLHNTELVEILNKKGVYLYLREITRTRNKINSSFTYQV